jgi:hypothetical protein
MEVSQSTIIYKTGQPSIKEVHGKHKKFTFFCESFSVSQSAVE